MNCLTDTGIPIKLNTSVTLNGTRYKFVLVPITFTAIPVLYIFHEWKLQFFFFFFTPNLLAFNDNGCTMNCFGCQFEGQSIRSSLIPLYIPNR